MKQDSDANPLYNKEGNAFTDELIDHWEGQKKNIPLVHQPEQPSPTTLTPPPPTDAAILLQAATAVVLAMTLSPWAAGLYLATANLEQTTLDKPLIRMYMNEQTSSFNENQLKRVGMVEAYTPELQEKMKQGVPVIQQPFKKAYPEEGSQVDVVLHLKKSATSDHYFLNKFDATLQKETAAASIKQTFYVNQENKYTLKEAANLLAGRPVHKELTNKEGQSYEAWVKLNPAKKLENGNHELKQYGKNYGFELDKTLVNYSIKEMLNDQYAGSLKDSLHRGNLQKATFVDKQGKEEKMYVSVNVTAGILNVYDENKQRMPLEKLVEKQYITEAFAQGVKERIKQYSEVLQPDTKSQEQSVKKEAQEQPKQKPRKQKMI